MSAIVTYELIEQEVREWIWGSQHLFIDIFNMDLSYEYQKNIFFISLENPTDPRKFNLWTLGLLTYPNLDSRIQRLFLDLKHINSFIYLQLYDHPKLDPLLKHYIFRKCAAVRERFAEIVEDLVTIRQLANDKSTKVRFAVMRNKLVASQDQILAKMTEDKNCQIANNAKILLPLAISERELLMLVPNRYSE